MKGFWDYLDDRVKGQEKNIPWFLNDKLKAQDFFVKNNWPAPQIIEIFDTPEMVELGRLPDEFCIKPTVMHSAAGVLPLVKVSSGQYFDRLRKRIISERGVISELQLTYDSCKFKGSYKVMVEQPLSHDVNPFLIPSDFKLYSFKNEVGLVVKIDRNTDRNLISFYDGEFNPLDPGAVVVANFESAAYLSKSKTPAKSLEMLRVANEVVAALDVPFVSVDMFSTPEGCFMGEITPAPGAPYYKKMIHLNRQWDRFLARLIHEGAD